MHLFKWAASHLFILLSLSTVGQQIEVDDTEIDFRQLSFQHDFITKNKIKTITVSEREMRYGQMIKDLNSGITYEFDLEGNCVSRTTTRDLFGRNDSIIERFELSGRELEQSIRQDQRSYLRLERQVIGDTTSFCRYRGNKAGEETWLSCEHHVSHIEGAKKTIEIMNDQKRPYQTRVFHFDSLNYLTTIEYTNLVTRNYRSSAFSYTEIGQLESRIDQSKKETKKWTYLYGEDSTLESIYYFENDNLIWEREIVIGNSGKIDALLKRDPSTGDIKIDKYIYEFHE
ncbi:MAG: hypothetical protein ACI898_000205 [Flavobacteriales bacterium]|jgi:hypothetical protein